jgi:hypothetical protein
MQSNLLSWLGPVVAKSAVQSPQYLKRRIRIHDSDDEDVQPVECQERGPLHQHLLPNHPIFAAGSACQSASDSINVSMPPDLWTNSDCSDDEDDNDVACQLEQKSDPDAVDLLRPVADAPTAALSENRVSNDDSSNCALDIHSLNLWAALPKRPCQFIDLSAVHASDNDNANSYYDTDESDLTPGFISDNDDGVPAQDQEWVDDVLPITTRILRNAKYGTVIKRKSA